MEHPLLGVSAAGEVQESSCVYCGATRVVEVHSLDLTSQLITSHPRSTHRRSVKLALLQIWEFEALLVQEVFSLQSVSLPHSPSREISFVS